MTGLLIRIDFGNRDLLLYKPISFKLVLGMQRVGCLDLVGAGWMVPALHPTRIEVIDTDGGGGASQIAVKSVGASLGV